jgi:hypothetical protein
MLLKPVRLKLPIPLQTSLANVSLIETTKPYKLLAMFPSYISKQKLESCLQTWNTTLNFSSHIKTREAFGRNNKDYFLFNSVAECLKTFKHLESNPAIIKRNIRLKISSNSTRISISRLNESSKSVIFDLMKPQLLYFPHSYIYFTLSETRDKVLKYFDGPGSQNEDGIVVINPDKKPNEFAAHIRFPKTLLNSDLHLLFKKWNTKIKYSSVSHISFKVFLETESLFIDYITTEKCLESFRILKTNQLLSHTKLEISKTNQCRIFIHLNPPDDNNRSLELYDLLKNVVGQLNGFVYFESFKDRDEAIDSFKECGITIVSTSRFGWETRSTVFKQPRQFLAHLSFPINSLVENELKVIMKDCLKSHYIEGRISRNAFLKKESVYFDYDSLPKMQKDYEILKCNECIMENQVKIELQSKKIILYIPKSSETKKCKDSKDNLYKYLNQFNMGQSHYYVAFENENRRDEVITQFKMKGELFCSESLEVWPKVFL